MGTPIGELSMRSAVELLRENRPPVRENSGIGRLYLRLELYVPLKNFP
jgi:hypothetical protein